MLKSVEKTRKFISEKSGLLPYTYTTFADDLEVYLQAVEEEVEQNYIELPKDADGVPVKVGDMLEGERIGGGWCEPFEVNTMTYGTGGWLVRDSSGCSRDPRHARHYHEPSVEDLLLECCKKYHGLLIEGMSDIPHDMPAPTEIIAEYAERLQLKEDE